VLLRPSGGNGLGQAEERRAHAFSAGECRPTLGHRGGNRSALPEEPAVTESSALPVVFVHGLWLHASSWQPWLDLFVERGYRPLAPGWPGEAATPEETRAHADELAGRGITEITDSYAAVIDGLEERPVVIGHSFGGLIADQLLARGLARGAVVLSPAQFRGIYRLPMAQLRSTWPVLSHPRLRDKTWGHSRDSFAKAFANGVPREEAEELYERYAIESSARPLFQAGTANLVPRSPVAVDIRAQRGPLLIIAAGQDRTVPEATAKAAYRKLRRGPGVTEFTTFPDRGHSLGVDSGWREVADTALDFLDRHGLSGRRPAPAV
jgi:non-heme chloroperoxidase